MREFQKDKLTVKVMPTCEEMGRVADNAVIAAFFAVMIGVGACYSRRPKSSDQ